MAKKIDQQKLAEIEFHGCAGITLICIQAIVRLFHYGNHISKAMLLSHLGPNSGTHCFLLTINYDSIVAIKSGFSSGYGGEGCKGLSTALQLLMRHNTKIEEYSVNQDVIERIDKSCLLNSDLEKLESSIPIAPYRYHDYVYNLQGTSSYSNEHLKKVYPLVVPLSIIDTRLVDLALELTENPGESVLTGYRRLEDIVRERTGLSGEGGNKLFSKAFQDDESKLYWPDLDNAELKGRALLFTGVYMAYRNKRAHKELDSSQEEIVREFLLLNELYVLESSAILRPSASDEINKIGVKS
jgi:hypothetical protein